MASPEPASAQALAAAAQSLRDTAKWFAGGVAATAATVFAGTSLTSLGSLDPVEDFGRLAMAGAGLLVGFMGLGRILGRTVEVLRIRSLTMREISESGERDVVKMRETLEARYKPRFPRTVNSIANYVALVDDAREGRILKVQGTDGPDPADAILEAAARDEAMLRADGGFLMVSAAFERMMVTVRRGAIVAIVGFTVFAWAANPKADASAAAAAGASP
jgi:hypothetical protein